MNPTQRGAVKRTVAEKDNLHPRNPHRGRYDFSRLIVGTPELAGFVATNEYGDESIDFANPKAVKALNRALLQLVYGVSGWDIPPRYLCPPIPGRADYLHYLADLLAEDHGGAVPRGPAVRVLDIGTGANCVYPLIGQHEYGWQFVGSDIDSVALVNAQRIVDANQLNDAITLRLQPVHSAIFSGVFQPGELFDLTMCNPPFHASVAEASAGTQRKWRNLGKAGKKALNFGGQEAELCCDGGEEGFVSRMVAESARYPDRSRWYTTLVSKSASLPAVYAALNKACVQDSRVIAMSQGQKQSRIVVWSFRGMPNQKQVTRHE